MSPLIELIFTALTHERQAAWPALGIPRWFKPLKILAKGLMTGPKIAITFDTHAGDAASNTDLLRGHAIILNTPVSLPRTAFSQQSSLLQHYLLPISHTRILRHQRGGEDRSGSLPAVGTCSHTFGAYLGASSDTHEHLVTLHQ